MCEFTDYKRELLGDLGTQAIGHFFYHWGEDSAPAILAPYKHRYCETQHGSAYGKIGTYLFDLEFEIVALLHKDEDEFTDDDNEFLVAVGNEVEHLIEAIDNVRS